MKKLTKIKYKDGELTLVWLEEQQDGQTMHKHELTSREDPEPEFFTALRGLEPYVLALLELPDAYARDFAPIGLSLSYDQDGNRGFVITCLKKLEEADAPLVLNTPHLHEHDVDIHFAAALNEVCGRAERFINGARAQTDLFAREVAEQLEPQLA